MINLPSSLTTTSTKIRPGRSPTQERSDDTKVGGYTNFMFMLNCCNVEVKDFRESWMRPCAPHKNIDQIVRNILLFKS